MRKPYALTLLLLPLLALSACTSTSEVSPAPSTSSSAAPSASPSPTPSATSGQVLGSVTASTNKGEATTFALPASGYKVQVLCEGDAAAKLRVSVRTEARKIDASRTVDSTTNSADISCLSNKPYVLMTEPLSKAAASSALLRLEVLSGSVSHASATAVAN